MTSSIDNCATRIRDALIKVLGTDVRFDPNNTMAPQKSYRQMINEICGRPAFLSFHVLPGAWQGLRTRK